MASTVDVARGAMRDERPGLLTGFGWLAILGPVALGVSIVVADFVVPGQSWRADTISDLGAGQGSYEMIVDIGLYAFSAALIACAVGASHAHMGRKGWSFAIYGLVMLGLIVFLVGARNEYGDGDSEGVVIHTYLVYGLGVLFAAVPWGLSAGAGRLGDGWRRLLRGRAALWAVTAPVFFFMPDGWDGAYERGLFLIGGSFVVAFGILLIRMGRAT